MSGLLDDVSVYLCTCVCVGGGGGDILGGLQLISLFFLLCQIHSHLYKTDTESLKVVGMKKGIL